MKSKLSFRKATSADVAFLYELRLQTMAAHLKVAGIAMNKAKHMARIEEAFADSYLILYKEGPIGLIKLGIVAGNLHIRQFQIMPYAQNKGIGTQVLKVVKAKGAELNLNISLNVLLKNPVKALYEKHGFKQVSVNDLEYQMLLDKDANT